MNNLTLNDQLEVSASIFNLLSTAFYEAITDEKLKVFTECFHNFPLLDEKSKLSIDAIINDFTNESLHEIKSDFNNMFIGGPHKTVYPWGSFYTDKDRLLFGESTRDWKKFTEKNQIKIELNGNEPSDHFALIFASIAAIMTSKKSESIRIELVSIIINEHLFPWLPIVLDGIYTHSNTFFYKELSLISSRLILYWK
ncbi:molecular chaperone [Shewanella sp. 6_MG-2023]|uniref:TorD/DmsD family molecular chaperone n=1 Tax=Shewanella sp. 6_MG-2023 TaxID=3062660 RepID=UPI0026E45F7E|nr:molecular chaperone TorD family protein [Shewanella sp. 6_MG-2023]MDO6621114.1 molecular chaperone TorD family protein [Shewanella sp. 6_MG-2023]